jgi:hypothetical protein
MGELFPQRVLPLLFVCLLYGGCRSEPSIPSVEFTTIPLADRGGVADMLDSVEGHVSGVRPGQRIVLYARSGAWYVQPLIEQPFTEIEPDSTWRNTTHLGTEYAALLVESDYLPPAVTDVLPRPGGAVVAVAVVEGFTATGYGVSPDSLTFASKNGSRSGRASPRSCTTHSCKVYSARPCSSTSP